MALDSHPPETRGAPEDVARAPCSGDSFTLPTAGVVFLVLLILVAIVAVVVLAWIGPVAGSDWATVTSAI
jgi:hypothetical protein